MVEDSLSLSLLIMMFKFSNGIILKPKSLSKAKLIDFLFKEKIIKKNLMNSNDKPAGSLCTCINFIRFMSNNLKRKKHTTKHELFKTTY